MGKSIDNYKDFILKLDSDGVSSRTIVKMLKEDFGVDFHRSWINRSLIKWKDVDSTVDETMHRNNLSTDDWKVAWVKDKTTGVSVLVKNNEQSMNFNWSEFIDVMSKTVTPTPIEEVESSNNLALHLYHSDMHIGAWVSDNSVYDNSYSFEQVMDRLAIVRALARGKRNELGTFHTLVMFDLGDMLDGLNGNTTRGGHKLPQNMNNIEQFDAAVTLYKIHIKQLVSSQIAENYVFYATCNDNHSGNFSYFALRALAEWCVFAFPQVKVIIQTKFMDVYKYGSHSFIISHGKDIEFMKFGMPKYLDKKTEVYIKDYIHHFDVNGHIHFIKGDLHQDSVDFCNRFRYRNVLSLFGASEWIFTNYGYSKAGISYDIVNMETKDVMEGRLYF